MDEAATRTIRLLLRYDGTLYAGWQRQPDAPTIQATVEAALGTIIGEEPTVPIVHGSGRTDAGVHALGQVAHFETRSRLPARTIARALNARLPHDVAIVRADDAEPGFHARFSARRKTYLYQFRVGDSEDPFARRFCLHLFRAPDVLAMRSAAAVLVGRHDFRSFASEGSRLENSVRIVFALRVLRTPWGVRVFATANGFLQHMVRSLAGLLLEAGRGKLEPRDAVRILDARDRAAAPAALPARGLFLWKVDY